MPGTESWQFPVKAKLTIALLVITCTYRQVLVYDILAQQNIVQAGGLSLYYAVSSIYTGIEYPAIEFKRQVGKNYPSTAEGALLESKIELGRNLLLAMVIITPVWTVVSIFLNWKLQQEMAWKTFRKMDADLVMQHKYRTFQVSSAQTHL